MPTQLIQIVTDSAQRGGGRGKHEKMDEMIQLLQPIQNKNDTVSTPHNTSWSVVENDTDDTMTEEADQVIEANHHRTRCTTTTSYIMKEIHNSCLDTTARSVFYTVRAVL